MARVETILHKGKKIILLDLSHCAPDETMKTIAAVKLVIGKSAPKSALVLTDVTEATYTKEVAGAIKDLTSFNTPYVKASAVVGATGVRNILLNTVTIITRRELKTFDTRESAKDWLASL